MCKASGLLSHKIKKSAIQRIIPLITEEAQMDEFENSKARNVIDRHGWKCSPDQASVFEQIIYGVYNNIRRGHGNAYINLELDQIWTKT